MPLLEQEYMDVILLVPFQPDHARQLLQKLDGWVLPFLLAEQAYFGLLVEEVAAMTVLLRSGGYYGPTSYSWGSQHVYSVWGGFLWWMSTALSSSFSYRVIFVHQRTFRGYCSLSWREPR